MVKGVGVLLFNGPMVNEYYPGAFLIKHVHAIILLMYAYG